MRNLTAMPLLAGSGLAGSAILSGVQAAMVEDSGFQAVVMASTRREPRL